MAVNGCTVPYMAIVVYSAYMAMVSACIVPVYAAACQCPRVSALYGPGIVSGYMVRVYVRAIVTGYTSMIMLYSDGRVAYQAGMGGVNNRSI